LNWRRPLRLLATPPHDADALRVADELLGEPPEQEQLFVASRALKTGIADVGIRSAGGRKPIEQLRIELAPETGSSAAVRQHLAAPAASYSIVASIQWYSNRPISHIQ